MLSCRRECTQSNVSSCALVAMLQQGLLCMLQLGNGYTRPICAGRLPAVHICTYTTMKMAAHVLLCHAVHHVYD